MGWITNALSVAGGLINLGLQWIGLRNTPEMKKAEEAQKQVDNDNQITKEVKDAKDDDIRKRISP